MAAKKLTDVTVQAMKCPGKSHNERVGVFLAKKKADGWQIQWAVSSVNRSKSKWYKGCSYLLKKDGLVERVKIAGTRWLNGFPKPNFTPV